jgi:Na+-driven multidrug efflux pump
MFLSTTTVYYVIRTFGVTAQAGFGIGVRMIQALLLPGMAIAFAAGPLVGQNYSANNLDRARHAFHVTVAITSAVMIATTALALTSSAPLTSAFTDDPAARDIARQFLEIASWTLLPQGLIYACAYTFQGLGNAVPALLSSMLRFVAFAIVAVWLSTCCTLGIEQVWYLWVGSALLQTAVSLLLLRAQFRLRLRPRSNGGPDLSLQANRAEPSADMSP